MDINRLNKIIDVLWKRAEQGRALYFLLQLLRTIDENRVTPDKIKGDCV